MLLSRRSRLAHRVRRPTPSAGHGSVHRNVGMDALTGFDRRETRSQRASVGAWNPIAGHPPATPTFPVRARAHTRRAPPARRTRRCIRNPGRACPACARRTRGRGAHRVARTGERSARRRLRRPSLAPRRTPCSFPRVRGGGICAASKPSSVSSRTRHRRGARDHHVGHRRHHRGVGPA